MPSPDMMKKLEAKADAYRLKFQTEVAAPSATDLLLKELITEVRGLRSDLKSERLLPDTPEVRRIRAALDQ